MDLNYLRRLLKIFDESSATELTIEEEGVKFSVARKANGETVYAMPQHMMHTMPMMAPQAGPAQQPQQAAHEDKAAAPAAPAKNEKQHTIHSPIVGTFYRAPAPDADPFVQVGTHIKPGSPLCIVEAMKLMNEIESDVSGTIVKVLIENGQPVEYNAPLFLVELD